MRLGVRIPMQKGELTIARKVLTTIVYREVREAPGVVELGGVSIWKRIARWLGLPVGIRGVRVDLGEGEVIRRHEAVPAQPPPNRADVNAHARLLEDPTPREMFFPSSTRRAG